MNKTSFHHANFEFQNYLHEQSSDIAMGVDSGDNKDEGAGDQGFDVRLCL